MKSVKLIDLDYNILAILLDRELSGYDVTQRLKHFRSTSHSRIYPALSKLLDMGYVRYRDVEQVGKPDKKLYTLTEQGIDILREWMSEIKKKKMHIVQDETMIRMLCLHLVDSEIAINNIATKIKEFRNLADQVLFALEEKYTESDNDESKKSTNRLIEMIKVHSEFDMIMHEWLLANIENNGDVPVQNLRDFVKERL